MKPRVLALDPGITTGYAVASIENGYCNLFYEQVVANHEHLWKFLWDISPTHIVCESFDYRPGERKGAVLYSCELIGIVHLFGAMSQTVEGVFLQQPSIQGAKSAYWTDAKLKESGLYLAGERYHHGRSAVKHLLHWLTFGAGAQYNVEPALVDSDLLLTSLSIRG